MPSLLLLALVAPAFATAQVAHDPDDPAIWVHPTEPSKSLILGTDKVERVGALYVFDLEGKVVQRIGWIDRPNNVDVIGNLAVVTERKKRRLRVFEISPTTGRLTDVTGDTPVFADESGEDGEPMGVALYARRRDRSIHAFVTPKGGPKTNHLGQYRLTRNPATKRYDAVLVRRFGDYSGVKETESIAVDQDLGLVFYSDETVGNRVYHADPNHVDAARELAFFNREGTQGDHEGIAVWPTAKGKGYLVCTDQIAGNSVYRVFDRQSRAFIGSFAGNADETDGIDLTSQNLGPRFPMGIFVAMNSGGKNFLVYDLRDVRKAITLQ